MSVNDGVIYPWTWVGDVSSHIITGLDLEHGAAYTMHLRAQDIAKNVSTGISTDGVTVDTEPPSSTLDIPSDYYNGYLMLRRRHSHCQYQN